MGSGRMLLTVMAMNLLKGLMSTPAVPLSDGLKLELGAGTASEFEVGSSQCRVENETNANTGGVVPTLYPKLPADFCAAVQTGH